ncbi:MAG: hypothetical protein LBJ93_03615, partial [Clostridiales bacterium]|nr:hypothetical protein [Clostridiales bacterium]
MQPDILNVRNLSIEDQVTYFASLVQEERNNIEIFLQLDPKARSQVFKLLLEKYRTMIILTTRIPYINRASNFKNLIKDDRTMDNLLSLGLDPRHITNLFIDLNDSELNVHNFDRLYIEQRTIKNLLSLNLDLEEKSRYFYMLRKDDRTIDNLKRFKPEHWLRIFPQLIKKYKTMTNLLEMKFSPEDSANVFKHLKDNQRTLENLLLFPRDKRSPERISPRAIAFEFLLDQYQKIENLIHIDKRDRRYCLQRIRNIHAALASPTLFQSFGEVDSERFFKKFYSRLG